MAAFEESGNYYVFFYDARYDGRRLEMHLCDVSRSMDVAEGLRWVFRLEPSAIRRSLYDVYRDVVPEAERYMQNGPENIREQGRSRFRRFALDFLGELDRRSREVV